MVLRRIEVIELTLTYHLDHTKNFTNHKLWVGAERLQNADATFFILWLSSLSESSLHIAARVAETPCLAGPPPPDEVEQVANRFRHPSNETRGLGCSIIILVMVVFAPFRGGAVPTMSR